MLAKYILDSSVPALHYQSALNTTFYMVSSDSHSCTQCATCIGYICMRWNKKSRLPVLTDPTLEISWKNPKSVTCGERPFVLLLNSWKTDYYDYYWENTPVAWCLQRIWLHMKRDVTWIQSNERRGENTAMCTGLILGGVKMWGGVEYVRKSILHYNTVSNIALLYNGLIALKYITVWLDVATGSTSQGW